MTLGSKEGMLADSDRLPCAIPPRTGYHECSDGDDIEWVGDSTDGGSVHGGVYVCGKQR